MIVQVVHRAKNNKVSIDFQLNEFSLVLPEPLILNQKSSGGNSLKHFRFTHQESLKTRLNLERSHRTRIAETYNKD